MTCDNSHLNDKYAFFTEFLHVEAFEAYISKWASNKIHAEVVIA